MNYSLPKWPLSEFATRMDYNLAVSPPDATYFGLGAAESRSIQNWKENWYRLWGSHLTANNQCGPLPESLSGIGAGAQECLLVMCGDRDAARIIVPATMVASAIRWANNLGLAAVPSPFLVHTIKLDPELTYSDSVEVAPAGVWDTSAKAFLYLANNANTALRAWVSELLLDDAELGRLFNYPQCCIEAFKRHDGIQPVGGVDFITYAPALTNQYSRLFGFELISHKPCVTDCSETLLMARQYLRTLASTSSTASLHLLGFLSSPVLVMDSRNFLIFLVTTQEGKYGFDAVTSKLLSFGKAAHGLRQRLEVSSTVVTIRAISEGVLLESAVFSKLFPHARLVIHTGTR